MRYKIRANRKFPPEKKVLLTEIVSKVELTVRYNLPNIFWSCLFRLIRWKNMYIYQIRMYNSPWSNPDPDVEEIHDLLVVIWL